MLDNEIKYVVEPYTKQQMMDINTEFVEVTADEHSDLEISRSFWRIDFLLELQYIGVTNMMTCKT